MIRIRPAIENEAAALAALMRGEPLRPFDRKWQNFFVAESDGELVGAVQIRCHSDGSREIGSLVVAPAHRGHGIASRLMSGRLAEANATIYAITGAKFARHYEQWGFREIPLRKAPLTIAWNLMLGQLAGSIFARLQRREAKRLVVLARDQPGAAGAALTQTAVLSQTSPE
ncbi:MAG: GNAT family N-acetyltransferase [Rhizobiaceae bacterium]